jgi:hypothetical protein
MNIDDTEYFRKKAGNSLRIGDKIQDGWIYIGEDWGRNYFARGCGALPWDRAMKFSKEVDAHLPSDPELDILQAALERGLLRERFNMSHLPCSDLIWGERDDPNVPGVNLARVYNLSNGQKDWDCRDDDLPTLLFRSEPHP